MWCGVAVAFRGPYGPETGYDPRDRDSILGICAVMVLGIWLFSRRLSSSPKTPIFEMQNCTSPTLSFLSFVHSFDLLKKACMEETLRSNKSFFQSLTKKSSGIQELEIIPRSLPWGPPFHGNSANWNVCYPSFSTPSLLSDLSAPTTCAYRCD